jgi:predicted Zn-dependent protease
MAKGLKSPIEQLRKAAKDRPTDVAAAVALAAADREDLAIRKRLVQMAVDAKDYVAAERWATEGIEIDVMDADLHRVVAESAAKRHNYTEAIEEYETAVELRPDDVKLQLALAETLVQAKQTGKAREVLKRLLKQSPECPGAKKLLESITNTPSKSGSDREAGVSTQKTMAPFHLLCDRAPKRRGGFLLPKVHGFFWEGA